MEWGTVDLEASEVVEDLVVADSEVLAVAAAVSAAVELAVAGSGDQDEQT